MSGNKTLYRKVRLFLRLSRQQKQIGALRQELMVRLCQSEAQEFWTGNFHLFLDETGEIIIEAVPLDEYEQLDIPFS